MEFQWSCCNQWQRWGNCCHSFCTVLIWWLFSAVDPCSDKRLDENKQKQTEWGLDGDIVDIRGTCVCMCVCFTPKGKWWHRQEDEGMVRRGAAQCLSCHHHICWTCWMSHRETFNFEVWAACPTDMSATQKLVTGSDSGEDNLDLCVPSCSTTNMFVTLKKKKKKIAWHTFCLPESMCPPDSTSHCDLRLSCPLMDFRGFNHS